MKRPITNDYLVSTRIPTSLAVHAKEVARTQGMNFSTFLRQSVKRNIDLYIMHETELLHSLSK